MKKIIYTKSAPSPIGPYNQAILWTSGSQRTLYTSGQIAINPETGELDIEDLEKETHLVMKNLEEVLKAADMDFSSVVKTSIFLSDMNNFGTVNKIYGSYFNEEDAPARETVEVANLPKFVNVEISAIAIAIDG
ncbi:Rid family detoxifying hydrolase [Nonlabens marinus]|uniref:Endoribonuclease L-PSP n=1 Tax=Nonlabens marinus S1-08 TaxID=1454201 RepID=W8VRH9_9FLAO|nr:Rid family detoxifying hydrolase [Nonlabens marinus]BAO56264.1 endoribonuclease L-PSP [Nonlabens marinus S1-08]